MLLILLYCFAFLFYLVLLSIAETRYPKLLTSDQKQVLRGYWGVFFFCVFVLTIVLVVIDTVTVVGWRFYLNNYPLRKYPFRPEPQQSHLADLILPFHNILHQNSGLNKLGSGSFILLLTIVFSLPLLFLAPIFIGLDLRVSKVCRYSDLVRKQHVETLDPHDPSIPHGNVQPFNPEEFLRKRTEENLNG